MMFFRVVLCLAGLLLYLAVKEFSTDPAPLATGPDVLQPIPLQPAVWRAPRGVPAAPIGTFGASADSVPAPGSR